MLSEIKYKSKIGNKKDLWKIVCFLNQINEINANELMKVMSKSISRDSNIKNIITLLNIINVVSVESKRIKLVIKFSNIDELTDFINKEIITELIKKNEYNLLFGESIKYSISYKKFYIKLYDINLSYSGLRNFLIDTELLIKDGNNLIFNDKYNSIYKKRKKTSLEDLLKVKELQAEIGRIGEEYVIKYEKNRLTGHRHINDITMISDLDVSAGYDIVSFESIESERIDRFIEVKAFSDKNRFYWSRNEIETAREYNTQYYLYLIDIRKIELQAYMPTIIENPYKHFIENNNQDWVIQNELLRITKL